jgi:hypothetical protein
VPVVVDVISELTTVLDAVCAADPDRLADADSIRALHRQLERLAAATTRASAAFDASGTWEADGQGRRRPGWPGTAASP